MKRTVKELENMYAEICASSYPYEWDENHISFQLMKRLRQFFSNRVVRFQGWSKIVDWRSFKNKGKQETKYGDIALIVNIQFSTGEILQGVACIEAKRSFHSENFESVNLNQLGRILGNVPYSHVLMYNHKQQEYAQKFPDESHWKSHFWISPINTAKQLLQQTGLNDNWKVLRTSFPFTMFLTGRIFWGFDLDFRPEILADIKTGENKIIDPSYLGVINIFYDQQSRIEVDLADLWEAI